MRDFLMHDGSVLSPSTRWLRTLAVTFAIAISSYVIFVIATDDSAEHSCGGG